MSPIPLIKPNPCKLSEMPGALRGIEGCGIYSNFGPLNTQFERRLIAERFDQAGECLTVCNATIGLMMAIRAATLANALPAPAASAAGCERRYALMPAFTFAATAHAAIWAGLTPLFCDIDPHTWLPCPDAEADLLRTYGSAIAVIVPCATFGACLDLDRYVTLSQRHAVPVVVDAAASLGALDRAGRPFGAGCPLPVVFSMHATKTFAVGEGGVIYADDPALMRRLRAMANFGFDQLQGAAQERSAGTLGLNAKLSEVAALLALAKLDEFDGVLAHRDLRLRQYREALPGWTFQERTGRLQPAQFAAVLPPPGICRDRLRMTLTEHEIGSGTYFSPHLAEQPYFRDVAAAGDLHHTDRLAERVLALPMSDTLTEAEVDRICAVLHDGLAAASTAATVRRHQREPA